jgi:hypothetical protein
MSGKRRSAWQRWVALAPLLLLVVSLPSQLMLRCRIDGSLRASCCCPDEAERDLSPTPTVRPQSCCDQEATAHEARLMEPAPTPYSNVLIPTSVRATFPFAAPEARALPRAFQQAGRARQGPPLVLLKQSFLI